jgi:hypothetical protein
VLRPALIRMGADLPLLLIFAGVIGGLLAFGLVGIFVGPVVLAVGYMLLEAWMADETAAADAKLTDSFAADRHAGCRPFVSSAGRPARRRRPPTRRTP